MNGVRFGSYHSYIDLGLILNNKTIGAALPKTAVIDIRGADGELDYTEYFGEINYKNRKLSFEFSTIGTPSDFLSEYSRIQRLLNGRKMNIYLDDDADYYYIGRISVNEWASSGRIGKIVIDVDAQPYKLKKLITVVTGIGSGTVTMNCHNLKKRVIPKLTPSAEMSITFGTYTTTIDSATTDESIVFSGGQNIITFTPTSGSASLAIEYQEGDL